MGKEISASLTWNWPIVEVLFVPILTHVMYGVPREKMKPFERITEREISNEDKTFILKIMKLNPRDGPTVKELLEDVWFKVD
jgi:hypothetical protein